MLDEHALNLHPVAQRRVLRALKSRSGQVLLVTHSPYMIPVDDQADLNRILRFDIKHGATRVNRLHPTSPVDPNRAKLARWLSELTEVRSLLFANAVILVEGPTEEGALPIWFAKSSTAEHRGTPDDLNLLVFNVGGDRNYEIFVSLSVGFGVPWAAICDARALGNSEGSVVNQGPIFRQLALAGVKVDMASVPTAFADLKLAGEEHGVFTLAREFDDEVEEFLTARYPQQYEAAKKTWPRSKVMAGRMIAQETPSPEEVNDLYRVILDWLEGSVSSVGPGAN